MFSLRSKFVIPYRYRQNNLLVRFMSADPKPLTTELGVYIHWPYCMKRCSYCNFNTYVPKTDIKSINDDGIDHQRMKDSLIKELKRYLQYYRHKKVNSIFFGGGTPSLALPSTLQAVIETVKEHGVVDNVEITMEANPTSIESEKMAKYKEAGVNRVSLGIQSVESQQQLELLGRNHSLKEAFDGLELARSLFPGKVSCDLIFGRPGQSVDSWVNELEKLLSIADNHISLYQLTLEKGTQLYKMNDKGIITMPDDEAMADMYDKAVSILSENGYNRYEISNFSRPGFESKHNQIYWKGQDYIGVGPGAHGRITNLKGDREQTIQHLSPEVWMKAVESKGNGTGLVKTLSLFTRIEETLCLGLRMTEGISPERWQAAILAASVSSTTINDINLVFSDIVKTINKKAEKQLLHVDSVSGLRATNEGLSVIDSLLPELLCELEYMNDHP